MNRTILSLSIASHLFHSPFYTIQRQYNYRSEISIINSHFSYSFSNFLYSNIVLHQTSIKKGTFSHILNRALLFTEAEAETTKPTVIKGQQFQSQQRHDSSTASGKLIIVGCTFSKCEIKDEQNDGGALFIEQDCYLVLHGTIFTECKVKHNAGAAYICKKKGLFESIDNYYTKIEDEKLQAADIQYCCFDRCFSGYENGNYDASRGFGPNAMIAGESVKLLYTSSSNHFTEKPDRNRGRSGVFDIQASSISILHLNITEGYSWVTGALDIRGAQKGSIKFQTLDQVDCQFLESFSNSDLNDISDANLIRNKMKKYIGDKIPAFIRARDSSVEICRYSVNLNEIKDGFKVAAKTDKDKSSAIMLKDWYIYGFGSSDTGGDFISDNVIYFDNNVNVDLTSISHLALGQCGGNVTVAQLIITPIFTKSDVFSSSQFFSSSFLFTKSDAFTKTYDFSRTDEFTKTGEFSKTNDFSKSTMFSNSDRFSQSGAFSESFAFSGSDIFGLPTKPFAPTSKFSDSTKFTDSTEFTKTTEFTESKKFSKSKEFEESKKFTESKKFSESKKFTESNKFITEDPTLPILPAIIPNNQAKGGKMKPGVIAAIAVGAAVAAGLIVVLGIFAAKKCKDNQIDEEDIETLDENVNVTSTNNPLYNNKGEDDPFKEDFMD